MEECVAEFEMRGMVVVLQAEGEGAENKEEKTGMCFHPLFCMSSLFL